MLRKFFVGCLFLTFLLAPIGMQASRQTRTLQPGYVYTFTGLDARVVSHVDVAGTGRYQIVLWDYEGAVTRFGFAAGRFSVSGIGVAEVAPLSPITVTFDSSRVRVAERAGAALRQIAVSGDTIMLENTGTERLQIRTNAAGYFDFVVANRNGVVTHFERAARLPVLSVPAGGTITVSAELLEVYFPDNLWQIDVLDKTAPAQALQRLELILGQVYDVTNTGDTVYTLRVFSEDNFFAYEYVIRGRDGHVVRHGETESDEIRLAARQSVSVTALADGELYFPYAWLGDLVVEGGAESPVYVTLQAGRSIEITNTDPLRTHTVFLRCAEDMGEFSFEYVTLCDDDDLFFNVVRDFIGERASVTVPSDSMVVVTALSPVSASVPDIPAVSYRASALPALTRRVLSPAVYAENTTGRDIPFSVYSIEETGIDFLLKDDGGTILTFGRIPHDGRFLLESGQSAVFSSDDGAVLIYPQLAALTIEQRDYPALYRRVLSYGEVLQIDNIDRARNRLLLVQNEGEDYAEYAYDFVMAATQGNIVMDYGFGLFGWYLLPVNRRITIMPQEDVTLSVVFPQEWYGRYLRLRSVAEEPLYRITVAPGRSVNLFNRAATAFALANNSRTTRAGFHVSGPGEWVREFDAVIMPGEVINPGDLFPPGWSTLFEYLGIMPEPIYTGPRTEYIPREVYVPQRPVDVRRDLPEDGDIILPANGRITVTAALGEDLEIWIPRSWARQMRITR
ncbi:MAG: hypothetical protein FWB80_02120 [Defluviitaleaceae bacterium]|nr:hypothetical protein [Defluviitaleaceae bacterium]